jgi:MFS family permease
LPTTENRSFPTVEPGRVATAKRTTHPNLILAICCTSLLIVGMDVTIVNVALPAIQKDLHAHLAGLQWILDAYTLVVASFLMLAGSISYRFGATEDIPNRAGCVHARLAAVQPVRHD